MQKKKSLHKSLMAPGFHNTVVHHMEHGIHYQKPLITIGLQPLMSLCHHNRCILAITVRILLARGQSLYCSPIPATVSYPTAVGQTLAVPAPEPFHHQLSELPHALWYRNAQEYTAHNTHERPLTTTGPLIISSTDEDHKLKRRNHKVLPRLSIPTKPVSYPECNWADMRPASPLRDWHKRGKKDRTNLRGGHVQKIHGERFRRHKRRYPKAVYTLPRLCQRNNFFRAQASAPRTDLKRAHDNDMRRQRKQAWRRDYQRTFRNRAAFADDLMQSGNTSLDIYVRKRSTSSSIKQEPGLVFSELSLPCTHGLPLPHRKGNYLPTPSVDAIKQELTTSPLTMDSLPLRPRTNQSAPIPTPLPKICLYPRISPTCSRFLPWAKPWDTAHQHSQPPNDTGPEFELRKTWRKSRWSLTTSWEMAAWIGA